MTDKTKISVAEVMDRIKQAMNTITSVEETANYAGDNGIASLGLAGLESKLRQLEVEIGYNNNRWDLTADLPISSHRKTIGRFIIFGKKTVRKLLRWYVNPLVDQQREYNRSVNAALNSIGGVLKLLSRQNVELQEQLASTEADYETRMAALSDSILEYKSRMTALNDSLLELGKTLIYTYADKDPEIALALAVEFKRQTANQEFMDIIERLNKGIILKELTR